jgi:hypothetical protein
MAVETLRKPDAPLFAVRVTRRGEEYDPPLTTDYTNIACLAVGHLKGHLVLVPEACLKDSGNKTPPIEVGTEWVSVLVVKTR